MKLHLGLRGKYLKFKYSIRRRLYEIKGNISFGKNVILEGAIDTPWKSGTVVIEDNTIVRKWVCLRPYGGKIKIGKNCTINSFCHISGNGEVEIGDNVLIATQCVIISANHNFDKNDIPIAQQGETRKKIIIEDDGKNALKKIINDDILFDIIFLDPPYNTNELDKILNILNDNNDKLNKDILIICETTLNIDYNKYNKFKIYKEKKYGDKIVTILKKI